MPRKEGQKRNNSSQSREFTEMSCGLFRKNKNIWKYESFWSPHWEEVQQSGRFYLSESQKNLVKFGFAGHLCDAWTYTGGWMQCSALPSERHRKSSVLVGPEWSTMELLQSQDWDAMRKSNLPSLPKCHFSKGGNNSSWRAGGGGQIITCRQKRRKLSYYLDITTNSLWTVSCLDIIVNLLTLLQLYGSHDDTDVIQIFLVAIVGTATTIGLKI